MPTIREYLVSLGAEVDNKSFSKFNAALKGAGVTAAKFGAGMAALMTMVAKTSISLDKTTQSYDALAKKQHKSIELIRAQETALKILGKTQKEVDADKELKAQYKELKALGKEMAFPTVAAGEKTLRGFLQDFDKFRMVSTYAINWVNHEFLAKIAAPLGETRKGIQNFTERLKKNMPRIADRVSQVFSNMFRLALAGVNAFGKLLEKIEKLPPAVKLIGAAIVAAFGLSKLGPVMLIIGGITTILALLDDYQTWLRGGNAALGEFWAAMKDGSGVDYMKAKLGELPAKIKEVNDKITEFLSGFFTKGEKVATEMLKGIAEHDWSGDGQFIGKFFGDLVKNMLTFLNENLSNGTTFFASVGEVAGKLLVGLSDALSSAMATFPWAETLSGLLTGANNILTIVGGLLFGGEGSDGTQYDGLVKNFKTVAKNLISGIAVAFFDLNPSEVSGDISKVVNHIFELIGKFFTPEAGSDTDKLLQQVTVTAFEIGEKLFNIIGQSFEKIDMKTAGKTIGDAFNHIMERVINWLGVVSINLPFFTNTAKENMKKVATGILTFLGSAFETIKIGDVQTIISNFFGIITGFIHQVLQADPKGESILSEAFSVMGNVALGLVEAVLGGIGSINFEQVSADIGSFVERVFGFIADIFGEKTDEQGNTITLADRVAKLPGLLTTIAQGMINGIASAFSLNGANGLHLDKVSDSVSAILSGIFGLIGQVFSAENVAGAADVLANLVSVGGEVAKGLIGGIASMFTGDKAPKLAEVTAPIKNIMSGLFKLIGDVFSKENATTLGDILGSVADIGLTLGIGIINSIGDLFGDSGAIPLDKVSGSIGTFISTLFDKIAEYAGKLTEKDENGKTFGDKFVDGISNIATGIVGAIGDGIGALSDTQISDSVSNGVNKMFQVFASLFTSENIGKLVDVATSISDLGSNIAVSAISFIGDAFGKLEADKVGATIGNGIKTVFTKLNGWLVKQIEHNKSGNSILGTFGVAIGKVAQTLLTMIGTALSSIDGDSLAEFVDNIVKFISTSFEDLADRITKGEIDLPAIGETIGNIIGSAIKISTDFLDDFVDNMLNWLTTGGGMDALSKIGESLLAGILNAIGKPMAAIAQMFGLDLNYNPITQEELNNWRDSRAAGKQTANDWNTWFGGLSPEEQAEYVNGNKKFTMYDSSGNARELTFGEMGAYLNEAAFGTKNPLYMYNPVTTTREEALGSTTGSTPSKQTPSSVSVKKNFWRGILGGGIDLSDAVTGSENGEVDVPVGADTTQAKADFAELKADLQNGISIPYRLTGGGGGTDNIIPQAFGGRFSTATRGVFGEDGTEYIIPITKPSRAKALILQMLQEMGAGANDILSEWGATGGGGGMGGPGMGWSSQPAAMYPQAGGNVKSNSDNNVNVPTTINVYGSGDALMTGQAAARASQSNVLRAVRGVVGA